MVNLWWLGMLNVNGYITLTTAVNLAARSGNMDAVWHVGLPKLVDKFIHHGFNYPRGIGAWDITMEPALGMRDHGDRVLSAANYEACIFQSLN
jgi:hypothetical protein